ASGIGSQGSGPVNSGPGAVAGSSGPATGGPSGTSGVTSPGASSTACPNGAPPAGGNGGATDVGVTATSITIGNVSDLGGPVPGLFQGGPYGTQAYFDYINSQGGVYGRKLYLKTVDDKLDCSQNEAAYHNLAGSVSAFVGSWSLDDYCGAQVLAQHPAPAIQQA